MTGLYKHFITIQYYWIAIFIRKALIYMDKQTLESTNKLLMVIIALLLRGRDEQELTLRQKIEILNELGLKPMEIAEILGRTNTHINKELTGIRKSQKQRK